jgi:hypothetical protein
VLGCWSNEGSPAVCVFRILLLPPLWREIAVDYCIRYTRGSTLVNSSAVDRSWTRLWNGVRSGRSSKIVSVADASSRNAVGCSRLRSGVAPELASVNEI